jgi:anti-sigma factor RsiW
MTTEESGVGRVCREVQAQLPGLLGGTLPAWRRRLVERHVRGCERCGLELERQQAVATGLDELGSTIAAEEAAEPPADLLDALLEQAERPGVRERAAVPARGAVSGARPVLSLALLVIGAVAGTAAGYTGWRGVRAVRRRLGGP